MRRYFDRYIVNRVYSTTVRNTLYKYIYLLEHSSLPPDLKHTQNSINQIQFSVYSIDLCLPCFYRHRNAISYTLFETSNVGWKRQRKKHVLSHWSMQRISHMLLVNGSLPSFCSTACTLYMYIHCTLYTIQNGCHFKTKLFTVSNKRSMAFGLLSNWGSRWEKVESTQAKIEIRVEILDRKCK